MFAPASRRAATSALLALLAIGAGCAGSSSAQPPLVQLEPGVTAPDDPTVPDPAPDDAVEASSEGEPEACEIAHDREVAEDLARWPDYRSALAEVLPPEHDVDDVLAQLAPDTVLTPRAIATMDLVWTTLHERCAVPAHVRMCQSLLFFTVADPLGRGASGEEPAQVEVAFDVAEANLRELIDVVAPEPDVVAALEAHLRVVSGAREAFAAAGWGPDGVAGLEPMADDLEALGDVEVTEPLGYLEGSCGFW